jgi:hypothetical protein
MNKIKNEKDIERIFLHNKALEQIPFSLGKADVEGWVYCLSNDIFNGYLNRIYKIGSTVNIENMLKETNLSYFESCTIIRQIYVPRKIFYEYMLVLRLNKYRVNSKKSFYYDIDEINKAFDELEFLLENKTQDYIHDYYLNFMNNFSIDNYCRKLNPVVKICTKNPEIKLTKKKQMKIDLNSDKSGFIYWVEHPYIKDYFNNKIQIIIPSPSEEIPWSKNNFVEDIKIIRVLQVKYLNLAKNMLFELGYRYNIKSFYYLITKETIIKIFDLIDKYFKNYPDKFQLNFAFGQRKFVLEL